MKPFATILLLVAMLIGAVTVLKHEGSNSEIVRSPIIAQLFSEPGSFAGKQVMIYGLVVESLSNDEFLIQDVSQRPLRIVASGQQRIEVGDQVMVSGEFRTDPVMPYIAGRSIVRTQVLGGGGCC